jgi:hypothetical protein
MPVISSDEMAQANAVLDKVSAEWLQRPGVTAVDLGFKWHAGEMTPQLAVRVHVMRKKAPEDLAPEELFPREVDGVPIDVIEASYRPQHLVDLAQQESAVAGRARRHETIPLGVSIGCPQVTAGSLGAIVTDNQSGRQMILSNWHVLANSLNPQPDLPIWQPGRLDGGGMADKFATLDRWLIGPYDAAVAHLSGERPVTEETVEGHVLGPPRQPMLGMVVWKSGRTTGLTYGFVDGVRMQVNLQYPGAGLRRLHQVFRIIPRPGSGDSEVSAPGDSGSVWVEAASGQAVGLHFAGEVGDQPEYALAHDLNHVLEALAVTLVASPAQPVEPPVELPPAPPAPVEPTPPLEKASFWSWLGGWLRRLFG